MDFLLRVTSRSQLIKGMEWWHRRWRGLWGTRLTSCEEKCTKIEYHVFFSKFKLKKKLLFVFFANAIACFDWLIDVLIFFLCSYWTAACEPYLFYSFFACFYSWVFHWVSFNDTLWLMVTFHLMLRKLWATGLNWKLWKSDWLCWKWWTNQWPLHFEMFPRGSLPDGCGETNPERHTRNCNWYWCSWVLKLEYATLSERLQEKAACKCLLGPLCPGLSSGNVTRKQGFVTWPWQPHCGTAGCGVKQGALV